MFNKLYEHYKNTFDFELMLYLNRKTYKGVKQEQRIKDEIF